MPIHHANMACDNCGQRHARDHQGECVEQLVEIVADLQKSNARRAKVLGRLTERFEHHQTALNECIEALQDANDMMRRHIPADESVIVPGICRKVDAALARKAVTQ